MQKPLPVALNCDRIKQILYVLYSEWNIRQFESNNANICPIFGRTQKRNNLTFATVVLARTVD